MNTISYRNLHFLPSMIQHVIWLYARFNLSFRQVEELLAERDVDVPYETIRRRRSGGHGYREWRLARLIPSLVGA